MTNRDPDLTAEVELRNALHDVQVYEALAVATGDAHATLDVLLAASDAQSARRALEERFGFTEVQATAVLDLQFRRVTAMDRQRIEQRRQELADRVLVLQAELDRP